MPCLLGCLALIAPRVVIFLVWLFSNYLARAYETTIWPLLGFLFLPYTTLAYAVAWHMGPDGTITKLEVVLIVVAALVDLGVVGGNASNKRVRTYVKRS